MGVHELVPAQFGAAPDCPHSDTDEAAAAGALRVV